MSYAWTVIGAGPAGIAAVGRLLDHGIAPEEIAWVDPAFAAGDLGAKWRSVSSNTQVGLFLSYTRPPFVLYGTLWILLIAFLTINLPSAYQQLQAAFATIHPELEDASRILGASRLQSLVRITAPLLRTGVIATWCFIFIGVMRELSAAIVLFTSQTKVISVLIYDLNESGDLAAISVLGIAMLVITSTVLP